MKPRYYYDPLVEKTDDGIYLVRLYVDKGKKKCKCVGAVRDHSCKSLMEKVHKNMEDLNSIPYEKSFVEKIKDIFK